MVAGGMGDAGGPLVDQVVDVGEAVSRGSASRSCGELGCGDVAGARASGRTAQTAATQGRLVRVCHSWARSSHWQGPTVASMASRYSRARRAGSPMRRAASACWSMAMGSAGCWEEGGVGAEEFAEEDLGVGEGAAGGGVGGYGLDGV